MKQLELFDSGNLISEPHLTVELGVYGINFNRVHDITMLPGIVRALTATANRILSESGLSIYFWKDAFAMAAYIRNIVTINPSARTSPYNEIFRRIPPLTHIRTNGNTAKVIGRGVRKGNESNEHLILVGYDGNCDVVRYRLHNYRTEKVKFQKHAEIQGNVKCNYKFPGPNEKMGLAINHEGDSAEPLIKQLKMQVTKGKKTYVIDVPKEFVCNGRTLSLPQFL